MAEELNTTGLAGENEGGYRGIVVLKNPLEEKRSPQIITPAEFKGKNKNGLPKHPSWIQRMPIMMGILFCLLLIWLIVQQGEIKTALHQSQLEKQQHNQQINSVHVPKIKVNPLIIADFVNDDVSWWKFDNLLTSWMDNPVSRPEWLSSRSLRISGGTQHWYIGGTGKYLGVDARNYTHLSINVYGEKEGVTNGVLKIELVDDDNGNFKSDAGKKAGILTKDDRYIYLLPIRWQGWRHLNIPFSAFEDDNPRVGDDLWNPSQWKGSGGLLQIQFIAQSDGQSGEFNGAIDTVRLVQILD